MAYRIHEQWRDRSDPYDVFSDEFKEMAREPAPRQRRIRAFHSYHAAEMYGEARSWRTYQHREWQDKANAFLGLQPAFPFLDRDLIAYLMAIPGAEVMHGGVPKAILRQAMHDLLPPPLARRRDKGDATGVNLSRMECGWKALEARMTADRLAVAAGYVDGDKLSTMLPVLLRGIGLDDPRAWRRAEDLLALELWLEDWTSAL
jgi:asparagine synthetase B (glutamine-hydrolysing)